MNTDNFSEEEMDAIRLQCSLLGGKMLRVLESVKLSKILDEMSEIDKKLGSDYGWCEVWDYVKGHAAESLFASSGRRELDIFDQALQLAQSAAKTGHDIYCYSRDDYSYYFLGPESELLKNLRYVLDGSKDKLNEEEPETEKQICPHCGK